jgi:hypothetical protein
MRDEAEKFQREGSEGYIMVIITINGGAIYGYIFISIGNAIKNETFLVNRKKKSKKTKKHPTTNRFESV